LTGPSTGALKRSSAHAAYSVGGSAARTAPAETRAPVARRESLKLVQVVPRDTLGFAVLLVRLSRPVQTATFLRSIQDHRMYAAYRLIASRGLRRARRPGCAGPMWTWTARWR
jgi:hypothetical protein